MSAVTQCKRCGLFGGHSVDCFGKADGVPHVEATKADGNKPRLDLVSEPALIGLAKVLEFGAAKYAADNWRKGMAWRRCIGAAIRHLLAFSAGEDNDLESGLPHIDHALCCLMFLSEYQKRKLGTDDRFKEPTL